MPQTARSGSRKEEQSTSMITRACDMCRQKKIRCDVVSGTCVQCVKYKTACHFTPISMKRAPRRSGRDKRVEELEERLKSMENQLKNATTNEFNTAESGNDSSGHGDSPFSSHSESGRSGTSNTSYNQDPGTATVGENFQISDLGEESLKASPFRVASSQSAVSSSRALNFLNNPLKSRSIQALPPEEKILSLVEKSFDGFHSAFPLFDQSNFMSIFNSLDTSIKDPGRWACLNVVLALAPQFRHHARAQDLIEDRETWGYFQNAFAVVGQLMTMHVTLWSVQALLGMALVIQGTPNQGPVSLLTSAALKLAHRMGLHRQCQNPNISAAEIEERKRVFWIAYSLDKDLSLQMGQPSAQDDDDMDVDFPSDYDSSLMYPGESYSTMFLNYRARLAMIQGQIYKRLCSVKATKQSVAERVAVAKELEAMLESWKSNVPLDLMRDYEGQLVRMQTSSTSRHPVALQLSYFNSLAIIYNSLPAMPTYPELLSTGSDAMELQLLPAPLSYATEARKAIRLLQVTPRRKYACVWAVLHIFVTATTTLLNHIIFDPSHAHALSDLTLIEPLLTLLGVLSKSSKGRKSARISCMHASAMELFAKANVAVEGVNLAGMDWEQCMTSGAPPDGRGESVGEFLARMEDVGRGFDVELSEIGGVEGREFAFAVEGQFLGSTHVL